MTENNYLHPSLNNRGPIRASMGLVNDAGEQPRAALGDRELLAMCATGDDERAFAELFERHTKVLVGYARVRGFQLYEAEDIAQDAFVLLWEKRRSITVVTESVLPWLLVTARNRIHERLRTLSRHRTDSTLDIDALPSSALSAERQLEQRRLGAALEHALAQLKPLDRAIVDYCLTQGAQYQQAAAALGLSLAAVRGRLARARVSLRTELAAKSEGDWT